MSKEITISWSVDDVLYQAKNDEVLLTVSQAEEILENLKLKHDATIGINWDVISEHIAIYKRSDDVKVYDPNLCPSCLSENVDYGAAEIVEESLFYPVTCNDCGEEAQEWYSLNFDYTKVRR